MFSKKMFGDMRRAGMTVGLSKAKISLAMEYLIEPLWRESLEENFKK